MKADPHCWLCWSPPHVVITRGGAKHPVCVKCAKEAVALAGWKIQPPVEGRRAFATAS